jgi:hypothetical protein
VKSDPDRFRACLIHFSVRSDPLSPDKIVVVQFTTPGLVANAKWQNGLKPAGNQHVGVTDLSSEELQKALLISVWNACNEH